MHMPTVQILYAALKRWIRKSLGAASQIDVICAFFLHFPSVTRVSVPCATCYADDMGCKSTDSSHLALVWIGCALMTCFVVIVIFMVIFEDNLSSTNLLHVPRSRCLVVALLILVAAYGSNQRSQQQSEVQLCCPLGLAGGITTLRPALFLFSAPCA